MARQPVPHGGEARQAEAGARERIIDAAQALFAVNGYAATPTKAVADAAGVASGLVFYYFPSKQQLLEALLAERSFAPELTAILADPDPSDPRATLRLISERFAALLNERRDIVRILLTTVAPGTGPFERFQELLRVELTALSDYLLTSLGPAGLEPRHARAMAHSLMATVVFSTIVLPPAGDRRAHLEDVIDVLLDSYLDGS